MLKMFVALLLVCSAQAQEETEENTKNFTAKVRVIREDTDGMEVFFTSDKAKGAYSLLNSAEHYGKMLKDLEASKKPTGPEVSVTVDSEKRIKAVEINKNKTGFQVPADPNQKWDFGKIPDNL